MQGGGNFLTQAYPTNFHVFFTQKSLLPGESADEWREVTPAEKAAIEAQDAKWVEPSDDLIARWNAAFGKYGKYNEITGYFEGNTLIDITTEQAEAILAAGAITSNYATLRYTYSDIRTNVPIQCASWKYSSSTNLQKFKCQSFLLGSKIEVFNATTKYCDFCLAPEDEVNHKTFDGPVLRKIIGYIDAGSIRYSTSSYKMFGSNPELEEVFIKYLSADPHLEECPKINLKSIEFMVKNRLYTSQFSTPFPITLHPDAYARVTDEIFAAALAKNITITTTE